MSEVQSTGEPSTSCRKRKRGIIRKLNIMIFAGECLSQRNLQYAI